MYIHELDRAIHKSTDGGLTWTNLFDDAFYENFRKADSVKHLAVDPNNANNLFSVSPQGILRSTDGGSSWAFMDTLIERGAGENAGIKNITVMPGDSNTILFTTGRLIHRTTDGGVNWESIESFASGRNISDLVVKTGETTYIIAGVQQPQESRGGLLSAPSR